jgi:glutamate transport system substrate-binding protein
MVRFRKGLGILMAASLAIVPASASYAEDTSNAAAIDKEAFDSLLAEGATAQEDVISANEWADAVRDAGVLKVGGVPTSFLFSQLDETDNGLR